MKTTMKTTTKLVKTASGDLCLEEWADYGKYKRRLSGLYMPDTIENRRLYGAEGKAK